MPQAIVSVSTHFERYRSIAIGKFHSIHSIVFIHEFKWKVNKPILFALANEKELRLPGPVLGHSYSLHSSLSSSKHTAGASQWSSSRGLCSIVLYLDRYSGRYRLLHNKLPLRKNKVCHLSKSFNKFWKYFRFFCEILFKRDKDTRNQNGTAKKDKRSRSTIRVPSFTAIAEVGETQMTRSQSVGTNMVAKKASSRSQYNNKTDGTRCMLSQPLLFEAVPENRPLGDVHRRASGTLSRPDIFYQVN